MPIASTFIRRNGANGAGHVGWAFEHSPGKSIIGAIENFSGGPFTDPNHKGMWHRMAPNNKVLNYFKAMNYDEYKMLELPMQAVRVEAALAGLRWWEKQSYNVLFANCLHATYDILTRYGCHLPKADWERIFPNNWFDQIPVPSHVVVPNLEAFHALEATNNYSLTEDEFSLLDLSGEAIAPEESIII